MSRFTAADLDVSWRSTRKRAFLILRGEEGAILEAFWPVIGHNWNAGRIQYREHRTMGRAVIFRPIRGWIIALTKLPSRSG
jgi:hypothetical protein